MVVARLAIAPMAFVYLTIQKGVRPYLPVAITVMPGSAGLCILLLSITLVVVQISNPFGIFVLKGNG